MSRKKVKQVKYRHINWFNKILTIEDDFKRGQVWRDYYILMRKHPSMSQNRLAYNALKRHYSTTALICARRFDFPVDYAFRSDFL